MLNLARIRSISQKFAQNCSRITTKPNSKFEFSDQEKSLLPTNRSMKSDLNKKSKDARIEDEVAVPSCSAVNSRLLFRINELPDYSKKTATTIDLLTNTAIDPSLGAKFYPKNTESTEALESNINNLLNKFREIELNENLQIEAKREDEKENENASILRKSLKEIAPLLSHTGALMTELPLKTTNENFVNSLTKRIQPKDQIVKSSITSIEQIKEIKSSLNKSDDVLSIESSLSTLNDVKILGFPTFNRFYSKLWKTPNILAQENQRKSLNIKPNEVERSLAINKYRGTNYLNEYPLLNVPNTVAIDIANKLKTPESCLASRETMQLTKCKLPALAEVKSIMPSIWDQPSFYGLKTESYWSKIKKHLNTFRGRSLKLSPPSFTVRSPSTFLPTVKQPRNTNYQLAIYKDLTNANQLQAQPDRIILKENLPVCINRRENNALIATNPKKSSPFRYQRARKEASIVNKINSKQQSGITSKTNSKDPTQKGSPVRRLKGGESLKKSPPNFTHLGKAVKPLQQEKTTTKTKVKKLTDMKKSEPKEKFQRTKAATGFLVGTLAKPVVHDLKSSTKDDSGKKTSSIEPRTFSTTRSKAPVPKSTLPTHKETQDSKTNVGVQNSLASQQLSSKKNVTGNTSLQSPLSNSKTIRKIVQNFVPSQAQYKLQHAKTTKVKTFSSQQSGTKDKAVKTKLVKKQRCTVVTESSKKKEGSNTPAIPPSPISILKNKIVGIERQKKTQGVNFAAPRLKKNVYTIPNKTNSRRSADSVAESVANLNRKKLRMSLYQFLQQEPKTASSLNTSNEVSLDNNDSNIKSNKHRSNGPTKNKHKINFIQRNKIFSKRPEVLQEKFNFRVEHRTIEMPRRPVFGYFKPVNIDISQLLGGSKKNKG